MKSAENRVSPVSEYYLYTPSKTAQRAFFYPTQCGVFAYEPGYSLQRQSLDSFLLMYIQKGTMQLDFGGKHQTVSGKSLVLIDCYLPHGYSTAEGYECLWLHFDGPMARTYYDLVTSRLGPVFSMADPFPVLRRLNAIVDTFKENKPVREALMSKYITDILTECLLLSPEKSDGTGLAERAVTYINEHFSEAIPLERLASLSGLSPGHFIRVFRRETGYTPHEYLLSRRMASARYLLRYTSLSVKEICFNTGFSSESAFCNAFRRHHGMSAQLYREGGAESAQSP